MQETFVSYLSPPLWTTLVYDCTTIALHAAIIIHSHLTMHIGPMYMYTVWRELATVLCRCVPAGRIIVMQDVIDLNIIMISYDSLFAVCWKLPSHSTELSDRKSYGCTCTHTHLTPSPFLYYWWAWPGSGHANFLLWLIYQLLHTWTFTCIHDNTEMFTLLLTILYFLMICRSFPCVCRWPSQ